MGCIDLYKRKQQSYLIFLPIQAVVLDSLFLKEVLYVVTRAVHDMSYLVHPQEIKILQVTSVTMPCLDRTYLSAYSIPEKETVH